ncbi:hypothetical protein ACOSQ2_005702 [Xanthoceras sorbifolium]
MFKPVDWLDKVMWVANSVKRGWLLQFFVVAWLVWRDINISPHGGSSLGSLDAWNWAGEFISNFQTCCASLPFSIRPAPVELAEAKVVLLGLQLAADDGLCEVKLESDALNVIKLIYG